MNGSKNKKAEESLTRAIRRVEGFRDWLVAGRFRNHANSTTTSWPVVPGAYVVGDRLGPVAICTLTSNALFAPLATLPEVAIAGRAYSANLGIEKMISNVSANPSIRFLLLCGKESPYFQVGQALDALFAYGVTSGGRIIKASGHMPELSRIDMTHIEYFRRQVELVNCIGETNIDQLVAVVKELSGRSPGLFQDTPLEPLVVASRSKFGDGFRPIMLGGHRESLAYDPMGFFIITLDREVNEILVYHYWSDHSPAHLVRGRNGEAILLALLREEIISERSHAGYLGAELAKAETAIRLGLHYEQDQPLRLQ